MTDAPVASSVGSTDLLQVLQGNVVVLATAGQLVATPMAQIASTNATLIDLASRFAVLEGKPDPCVSLSGTLPVATLQIGTTAVQVVVPGLLITDRVAVQPVSDLPAGLVLAWAHPAAAGVLTVALDALAVLAIKTPVPILVTALR